MFLFQLTFYFWWDYPYYELQKFQRVVKMHFSKKDYQICWIFAMIYFSLFLKSYFNFSIFISQKNKKHTDRSDVSVRHNTFRIVKNAFRKKIYIYITDVLYFRTIRITWKLRLYGVLIYFSIVNLVFHKTIILRSTCSVLLYI